LCLVFLLSFELVLFFFFFALRGGGFVSLEVLVFIFCPVFSNFFFVGGSLFFSCFSFGREVGMLALVCGV